MTRQLDGGDDRRGHGARLDGRPVRPARRTRVRCPPRRGPRRTRSGNTTTVQGQRATGTKTVSQTGEGYNVNKEVTTQSGASKSVSKDVNVEDREVERSSTTTNKWGESATRERKVEGQGGYATIEGKASTSTGREMETDLVAGRTRYGQPAVAGSVDTKYNGNYNVAAGRNPYGGWNTAVAGPYGGRVTTTLPVGVSHHHLLRPAVLLVRRAPTTGPTCTTGCTTTTRCRCPTTPTTSSPPVGAIIVMVAGVSYLMSQDGSYSKKTTSSEGKEVYQSVPPPQGASIKTLPATRVLVTVSGTTYYLSANAFYKRVMNGAQETWVTVTPPAGVVFVPALPADFEVVQLNTMYFTASGKYYVPYLSSDGKELYVMVDQPPAPPSGQAAAPAAAPAAKAPAAPAVKSASATAPAAPAAPIRTVAESFTVPQGTLVVVRLATEVSSATAHVGDRVQGFLDQDLAADGRLVAPKGAKVYGVVSAVDDGSKMKGQAKLSVTLTDMQVGSKVQSVKTQPVNVEGGKGTGAKKVVGGAAIGAAIGAIAGGGDGAAIGARGGCRCGRRRHGGEHREAGGHPRAVAAGVHPGGAAHGGDHDQRSRAHELRRLIMKNTSPEWPWPRSRCSWRCRPAPRTCSRSSRRPRSRRPGTSRRCGRTRGSRRAS